MALDTILIAFAFSAGAIAFINPCGFAMLPTYISYFIESSSSNNNNNSKSQTNLTGSSNSNNPRLISLRRLTHGALLGLLVTIAFIAIFGLIGIVISYLGIGIAKFLPWIAVLSGVVIIGIGAAKVSGKTFHVNIPSVFGIIVYNKNTTTTNDYKFSSKNYVKFFLFGIGYAIASLSCTIPIFLLVVFQGLSAGGVVQGSLVFFSYALGMGAVLIAVSLVIAISTNEILLKWLAKLAPKMNTITSIFLILAGSYLLYYNLVIGKLLVN